MSQVYQEAASVLRFMDKNHRGVRDAFYSRPEAKLENDRIVKQTFALVCSVSRDATKVKEILKSSGLVPNTHRWNGSGAPIPVSQISDESGEPAEEKTNLWSKRRLKIAKRTQQKLTNSVDPYVCMVMVWDLLFGRGMKGGGPAAKYIKPKEELLRKLKLEKGIESGDTETVNVGSDGTLPRYLRVNTSRISVKAALQKLEMAFGFNKKKLASAVSPFTIDNVVGGVIRVNVKDCLPKLVQHPLLKDGSVVFQDRASCLSALAADIRPGMTVVDACSAPGSKTLHCIDLMKGKGRVIAVERDPRRAEVLIHRLKLSFNLSGPFECANCRVPYALKNEGLSKKRQAEELTKLASKKRKHGDHTEASSVCKTIIKDDAEIKPQRLYLLNEKDLLVEIWIGDFLSITEASLSSQACPNPKCPKPEPLIIDAMLVDPSCSGSGLPLHPLMKDERRVRSLASFQIRILSHALTQFPSVKTVCYSTCSVYVEENEAVVSAVLNRKLNDPLNKDALKKDPLNKRIGCNESNVVDGDASYEVREAVPFWKTESETKHMDNYLSKTNDMTSKLFKLCFHSDAGVDECRGFFLAKICRMEHNILS